MPQQPTNAFAAMTMKLDAMLGIHLSLTEHQFIITLCDEAKLK